MCVVYRHALLSQSSCLLSLSVPSAVFLAFFVRSLCPARSGSRVARVFVLISAGAEVEAYTKCYIGAQSGKTDTLPRTSLPEWNTECLLCVVLAEPPFALRIACAGTPFCLGVACIVGVVAFG